MKLLIIFFLLIAVIIPLFGNAIILTTDWLWFKEINFENIFITSLLAKVKVGSLVTILFITVVFINIYIAMNLGKRKTPLVYYDIIEIPQVEAYRSTVDTAVLTLTAIVGYILSGWGSSQWENYLKFFNSTAFSVNDPLFSMDIGFYVFKLPFYRFLYQFSFLTLIFSLIAITVIYIFHKKMWFVPKGIKFSDSARIHCLVLGALIFLLMAFKYRINAYDLLYSGRGIVFGASYTDIKAELPVLYLMMGLSIIVAATFLLNIFVNSYKMIIGVIVLMLAVGFIGGKVYPALIQKFEVAPNEISKEKPYINFGVEFTRKAYKIDHVEEKNFPASDRLTIEDINNNDLTIRNIRLWDGAPLLSTYAQLQEIRTYYDFVGLDNDRYSVNGEYRQVMLSPRELSYQNLPSRSWINEHLTYTHGYGLCMGPVNQITKEGLPEFMIKDIPPVSTANIKVTRPEIYYGEIGNKYCFVNTGSKEFDYPSGDKNIYTVYKGSGGVRIDGFLKKVLFAVRFGEIKMLFSGDISENSRIMYYRSVLDRVNNAAPFIRWSSDPYLVISEEGRLFWIIDGYTTTSEYPYSEKTLGIGNYIRNSVKAVINAYDGKIDFYISDEEDPLIKTYGKIFPGVFKKLEQMPEDLKSHIRYPQEFFSIQAEKYAIFHMTDPQVFYNKEDVWKIPRNTKSGSDQEMEPYYTIMKLASEGTEEEFILMVPFTPSKKNNMISWMAARCDQPNYGKLIVYNFPKQKLVYGPQQIESRIDQDPEISKQLTLWNQGGSTVIRGSLLVIPIEQSLIYVQPLYLSATQSGGLPELKRVIIAFGNQIVMEENLENGIERIFGEGVKKGEVREEIKPEVKVKELSSNTLINNAISHYEKAVKFQRDGNWTGYGEELKELEKALKEMRGK